MNEKQTKEQKEFFELLADPDMSMQLEKLFVKAYELGTYDILEEIDVSNAERFYYDTQGTMQNNSVFKVFTFSNENIAEFFKNIDMTGKKLLTVGSSFDQAMCAILKGSTDVTVADLNFYTKYFSELKMAGVKNLTYEEFLEGFSAKIVDYHYVLGIENNFKIYQKISHDLSGETQMFWDSLFLEGDRNLFYELFYYMDTNSFYSYENYQKLQNILKTKKIKTNFVVADYFDFPEVLSEKYDVILLTNLYIYLRMQTEKGESFFETLAKLYKNNLNDGGLVQVISTFETEGKKEKTLQKDMKHFKKNIGADEVFYIKDAGMNGASSLVIKKKEKSEKEKF